ncbi:MAG TPA: tripartite tricarboxylate transporter substrate binding protein [Paracoccus sp. (in: a-proteobacteria)]|uniref:Bug family tripartite tricarboxylate transporter substrate binding protein n=1 Tax=Paracoccus sp. TaxID=267 RepID=UPI002C4F40C5|nr:tripartite tricarboxylate transporter substrate binding protein [Paracoccus sp. (in: a-proteobacteria)]HWL59032.1 tripartite tricarboxylate transporter substrate binding protein [Paracoccus sp. (in: a-proteobacteria)]
MKNWTKLAWAAGLAAGLMPAIASAKSDWPTKPVQIIVPYAPGGTSDTLGRIAAQGLTEKLGQQFNVENRPGAAGTVGSSTVAASKPDGYSLVVSGVGSHAISPAINATVDFDPLNDFRHIVVFGGPPSVLVVNPSLGVKTLAEFVELLKTTDEPVSYASPGAGSQGHLVGEYFKTLAGVEMEHIPYRGAGATIADIMSGVIQVGSVTLSSAAPQIEAGNFVPLAVTSAERVQAFPDIPTFAESGYPDLVATTWFGLSGPKDLPDDIALKINETVTEYLQTDAIKAKLEQDSITFKPMTLDEATGFFKEEIDRWGPVAKGSGAQIQ